MYNCGRHYNVVIMWDIYPLQHFGLASFMRSLPRLQQRSADGSHELNICVIQVLEVSRGRNCEAAGSCVTDLLHSAWGGELVIVTFKLAWTARTKFVLPVKGRPRTYIANQYKEDLIAFDGTRSMKYHILLKTAIVPYA